MGLDGTEKRLPALEWGWHSMLSAERMWIRAAFLSPFFPSTFTLAQELNSGQPAFTADTLLYRVSTLALRYLFKRNQPVKCPHLKIKIKILIGSGEMAQEVRVLAAFAKTWDKFPAPTWWLKTVCNSSSRISDAIL